MALPQHQPRLVDEIAEFLAAHPTDEEILAFHASDLVQARMADLLMRNRNAGLTPDESREMDEYEFLEHLVTMLKAKTHIRMKRHNA